jgi:formylmethanofuran dehydrogenase subunit D
MNDYKVKGLIKVIGDTVQVTEKFSKREIVITVEDAKYPQHTSACKPQEIEYLY